MKPFPESKEFVAFVAELTAAKKFAGACRGQVVLAQIDARDRACPGIDNRLGKIADTIEVETPLAADHLRFFGDASCHVDSLEGAESHADDDTASSRKQGEGISLYTVSPLVKVDGTCVAESDGKKGVIFPASRVV